MALVRLLILTSMFLCLALPAAAERRAVLIGINQYLTNEFMDLRGAVNDVVVLQEVLVGRFGFKPENITVLTDESATRAAILEALDDLAKKAKADDVIYLHYSGHGSQVQDLNGDEPDDGMDETILPHDARTEGIPDITDDELGVFLNRLKAETAVIVLDSCHSGTATRGGLVTRTVQADTRLDLYRRPGDDVKTRAIVQLEKPERYVLLTGAASHQSALDGPVGGEYRGFFSYALSQGLGSVPPGASPRDLHASIQQTFHELAERFGGVQLPEPQIEASPELLDRSLFPVVKGTESEPPPVLAETPTASRSLEVRLDEVNPETRHQLEQRLRKKLPGIEFVAPDEFARFVVDVVDGRCFVYGAAGLTVIDEFEARDPDKTAKRLAGLFGRSLKARELTSLTNPASELRVEAHIVGSDRGGNPRIRDKGQPRSPQTSLMLEIETNRDSYITVVDVDAEGGVNVLFPNSYTKEGFLPRGFVRAGRAERIPDSFESGNRAGFHWDYQPPAGHDTIQVFAATDLETAETIRKWLGQTREVATRGIATGGLDRFGKLRKELSTRGIGVVQDRPDEPDAEAPPVADWNAISLRIRVTE